MRNGLATWLRREHIRWRLSRRPLRLVAQAVVTAVLALAGFLFLRAGGDIN